MSTFVLVHGAWGGSWGFRKLRPLLWGAGHEVFTLIGSGLQHKFGQTTIARQDIAGSIPNGESERFMDEVRAQMQQLEQATGKTFGGGENPLLVSVRSGSAMSP